MSEKQAKKYMVDFVLRHLWHKISRLYNQKAAEQELTGSIGYILLNIEKDGTPSTQLGPKMGMEPTSLSRTIKTMEQKGLIRRVSDKLDKRKVLVFLTEDGLEKRRMARDVVMGFHKSIMNTIPKGKLAAFFEVAERLDTLLDEELNNLN